MIDVNFWGVVHGTRAFLPILLEQDEGAIVNVSSVFGLIGWPTQSAYCASKFAVRGYTESLRHELRETGVRAIAVHPGGIATNIVEQRPLPRRRPRPHRSRRARARVQARRADLARPRRRDDPARRSRRGRSRILIGADARMLAALVRVAPVRYMLPIKLFEPIVRR